MANLFVRVYFYLQSIVRIFSFYENLFESLLICDYPWESFLFMRIFLNLVLFVIIREKLFFLWESFWISYLWSSMRIFSFYENLFESLLICDHPWESFLFMRIFLNLVLFMIIRENLFFLWESFWISSYFWSSVRIFTFYENLFESLSFVWIYVFIKISKHINTIISNKSFIIKTRWYFLDFISSHFFFFALNSSHFMSDYFLVKQCL